MRWRIAGGVLQVGTAVATIVVTKGAVIKMGAGVVVLDGLDAISDGWNH